MIKPGRPTVLLAAIVAALAVIAVWRWLDDGSGSYVIALAAPMTGPEAAAGASYAKGVQLLFDRVNADGGVDGRRLVLEIFDDRNQAERAAANAREIVADESILAVIGHWFSAASLAAAPIYQDHGVAAITPGSSSGRITRDNPWYFRTGYTDDLHGGFIANYAASVLAAEGTILIHETRAYGDYLAQVIKAASVELGYAILAQESFDPESPDKEDRFHQILRAVRAHRDADLIYLMTDAEDGAALVKTIRDAGIQTQIIGPDSFATPAFQKALSVYPAEIAKPGFYSDGLLATSPLIFDTASPEASSFRTAFRAAYDEDADWVAAFAYDSATTLVAAIRRGALDDISGGVERRARLRDALAAIDSQRVAINGVTGLLYFDDQGDTPRSVSVIQYRNAQAISAPTQLQTVRNLQEVRDLEQSFAEGKVLLVGDQFLYRTDVVYAGVEIIEIDKFNERALTFETEFFLWFRYADAPSPEQVEFLNSLDDLSLGAPIEQTVEDGMTYTLYRVKGRFRADYHPRPYSFGRHSLGIAFLHRTLNRNRLIYVVDVLGMGTTESDVLADRMARSKALNPAMGWETDQVVLATDAVVRSSKGDPKYLNYRGGGVEYSRFNVETLISETGMGVRGAIPQDRIHAIFIGTLVLSLLLFYLSRRVRNPGLRKITTVVVAVAMFIFLVSLETLTINMFGESARRAQLQMIETTFDVLWWILAALIINAFSESFIWVPLEQRMGRRIPRSVRGFVAMLVFVGAFLGIMAFVYDQKITSLLATSGVVAMIIGLAIQVNIANIFAGIVLNIERPFQIGDWVKIGDFEEGEVTEFTWRTTRLRTRDERMLSVPNSVASESATKNFGSSDETYVDWFMINVDVRHPPERVKEIVYDAIIAEPRVIYGPDIYTLCGFAGITDWSATYAVVFTTRNYEYKYGNREAVWSRVWSALARNDIAPAMRRQEIHMFRGDDAAVEGAARPHALMNRSPLFRELSPAEVTRLSELADWRDYEAGTVIADGKSPIPLHIIDEGSVRVVAHLDDGQDLEVATLGPGGSFGDRSWLTGENEVGQVVAETRVRALVLPDSRARPLIEDGDIASALERLREKMKGGDGAHGEEADRIARNITDRLPTG